MFLSFRSNRAKALAISLAVASALALPAAASAQGRTLAAQDYAQAERFLSYHASPLVDHSVTRVTWLDDGRFWYRDHDADGDTFMLVDATAAGATPVPAFDHARMAEVLSRVGGKPVTAGKLPVTSFDIADDGSYTIGMRGKDLSCDAALEDCKEVAAAKGGKEPGVASPDGKSEAFIRDWNLWVRDVESGKETQLTRDGVEDYGYATDNAGWTHSDRAILVWSPDSSKIATFQQDQRKTGTMTLVATKLGHPEPMTWKYPLVGDEDITMIERVVIDVPTASVLRLQMPPDQHRSTQCDDVSCFGGWEDVQWAADGKALAFASSSRDHKDVWLRIADVATGKVREVMHEHVPTWFESGINAINWRYLQASNEILWWSQRNGWGNLYLYDAANGKLKHAVTSGEGNVTAVVRVDEEGRNVWFRGVGRTAGIDPYYQQLFKVSLDGGAPVLLTPEAADHSVSLSPGGDYFVDAYSTTTQPPVTVLRNAGDGSTIATVARADISRLLAAGWVAPEPIKVKARDGKTDLYGLMFKPSDFDPSKKYPIVNYVYPGPQTGSVRTRSFVAAHGDNQALAELGFVVVAIDGMGSQPWRSKAFHDGYAGNIGDNTIPDQVAGMKELGKRYPWIDLDRVGIWGHSGGGNATATALFRYGDFFKVGWSESGNHDNRVYEDDWAEKWQGLLVTNADGSTNYDDQANQSWAKGLTGKLMLVHGMMDDNVPPYSTFLVIDALVKANKDFDMIILPHARHGYGMDTLYITRRRWDYFVEHLAGNTPPPQYQMSMPKD